MVVTERESYFYVIHGVIPELMPILAYRRAGKENQHERKVVKCPFCKQVLTFVDIATKVELFRYPAKQTIRCQEYKKCYTCKSEVGIILA